MDDSREGAAQVDIVEDETRGRSVAVEWNGKVCSTKTTCLEMKILFDEGSK